ncbi:MAG: hypothetical protein M1813_007077 [Trichoglossum hirsutum]|nr:MAG: hypothetical protein M1813_007077 [Trichoglossum hirsutum]
MDANILAENTLQQHSSTQVEAAVPENAKRPEDNEPFQAPQIGNRSQGCATTQNQEEPGLTNCVPLKNKPREIKVGRGTLGDFEIFYLTILLIENTIRIAASMRDLRNQKNVSPKYLEALWDVVVQFHICTFPNNMQKKLLDELQYLTSLDNEPALPSNNLDGYPYGNLSVASQEIRLLVLHPSRQHYSRIRCDICKGSLQGNPPPKYEVLSHDWGHMPSAKGILLSGKEFPVTQSLELALRHLRDREKYRVLWIDALCVNHLDPTERNYTVKQMQAIFQTAQEVITWLGNESNTSKKALEFPRGFASPSALEKLFNRPWWDRGNIVAPLFKGCNVTVHCGNEVISWGTFRQFFVALHAVLKNTRSRSGACPAIIDRIESRIPGEITKLLAERLLNSGVQVIVPLYKVLCSGFRAMLAPSPHKTNWISATSFSSSEIGSLLSRLNERLARGYKDRRRAKIFDEVLAKQRMGNDEVNGDTWIREHLSADELENFDTTLRAITKVLNTGCSDSATAKHGMGNNENAGIYRHASADVLEEIDTAVRGITEIITDAEVGCLGSVGGGLLKLLRNRSGRRYDAEYLRAWQSIVSVRPERSAGAANSAYSSAVSKDDPGGDFYYHQKLDYGARQIRVLWLHPSADLTSDVYCDLVTFDLGAYLDLGIERCPYMALSYVWGKSDPAKEIFMNGKRQAVTPNLFTALQQLRDPEFPLLL